MKLPVGTKKQLSALGSGHNIFDKVHVLKFEKSGLKVRLVIKELFAIRSDNLNAGLVKLLQKYPRIPGIKYRISSVDRNRFLVEPSKIYLKNKMSLIRSLFLVTPDNTVISVDVFMNDRAANNQKHSIDLAMRILLTAKSGKRKLIKGPKKVTLGATNGAYPLRFYLPRGYVLSTKKNAHARVHIINKLIPVGESQSSLAIYIGSRPSPFKKRYRRYSVDAKQVFGRLLGGRANWSRTGNAKKSQRYNLKTSKRLSGYNTGKARGTYYIHVFVNAGSKKSLKRLIRLTSKLKLKKGHFAKNEIIVGSAKFSRYSENTMPRRIREDYNRQSDRSYRRRDEYQDQYSSQNGYDSPGDRDQAQGYRPDRSANKSYNVRPENNVRSGRRSNDTARSRFEDSYEYNGYERHREPGYYDDIY